MAAAFKCMECRSNGPNDHEDPDLCDTCVEEEEGVYMREYVANPDSEFDSVEGHDPYGEDDEISDEDLDDDDEEDYDVDEEDYDDEIEDEL